MTFCPACNIEVEYYEIPEINAQRCPGCFATYYKDKDMANEAQTEKATGKAPRAAEARPTKQSAYQDPAQQKK